MRWSSVVILSALSAGCFSPEVDTDLEASGTDSSSGGTDATSPSGGQTDGETDPTMGPSESTDSSNPTMGTATESDTTGVPGDDPPVIEAFEANGSATPADVTQSSQIHLSATVTDDNGVSSVAFYDGDTLLGTVTDEPFEFDVLVTSVDSGSYSFSAVATDTAEQETTSDDVSLNVSIVGGEVTDVNDELVEACTFVGSSGGLAFLENGRFVLAATGCPASPGGAFDPPNALIVDQQTLNVISSSELEGTFATSPTTLPGDRFLIPTIEYFIGAEPPTPPVWRYSVVDSQLGQLVPGAGLQFSAADGLPAAILMDDGVFLTQSDTDVALFEHDLDSTLHTYDLGIGSESANIAARTVGPSGELFVSVASDGCPAPASYCVVKFDPTGARSWNRGIQSGLFYSGLASDDDGGVFYALPTNTDYLVARLNADGDEVASGLLALDEARSTWPVIARDGQGGLVLAGAFGAMDNTGHVPADQSVLLRLDRNLETIWERTNPGPMRSRMLALGVDPAGRLVLTGIEYGSEDPTLFATEGEAWIARANL